MCLVLVNNHVFKLRNNSLALVAKGEGSTYVGTIIQAPEESRRRFPLGTRVIFKNDMGHVLCEGSAHDEREKCLLHELDAVSYQGTDVRFEDLIKRVKKKVKGRVILTVSAGEDQVVGKAEGEAPKKDKPKEVVAEKVVKFKDLKAGQKYKHHGVNNNNIYKRTEMKLNGNGFGQTGTAEVVEENQGWFNVGEKVWTNAEEGVILVA